MNESPYLQEQLARLARLIALHQNLPLPEDRDVISFEERDVGGVGHYVVTLGNAPVAIRKDLLNTPAALLDGFLDLSLSKPENVKPENRQVSTDDGFDITGFVFEYMREKVALEKLKESVRKRTRVFATVARNVLHASRRPDIPTNRVISARVNNGGTSMTVTFDTLQSVSFPIEYLGLTAKEIRKRETSKRETSKRETRKRETRKKH